jgi:perosamine synthetase
MRDFIPQIEPWIDESELHQLARVIKSTYVTENRLTEEFESLIRDLTGAKYAIAITNGTAALFCSLKALGIGPGDEVIVPDLTFIATANAVLMAGAKPIFCKIKKDTLCMDAESVGPLINSHTKAIMPVHLYGQSADMDELVKVARDNGLKIVEDAAQGVGVMFNGKHVGTFGELGILSFYGNKTITCGEGGVVLTNDKQLRDTIYRLKNHGRLTKGTFRHSHVGFNFAFTEMQAAIGISQMHKLPKIVQKKKDIHDVYCEGLKSLSHKFKPLYLDPRSTPVWWFTSFMCDRKEGLKRFLANKGVQTRDFFCPLHMQPCYENYTYNTNYQISESAYKKGISLPSSYHLTSEQQDYIISCIYEFYGVKNDTFS